jgi:hypothetical protein
MRLNSVPWVPLLLLALLVSNCMNWVSLRTLRREIESSGWSQHYDSSDLAGKLDAMNDRLGEISDSTQNMEACSKEIRPVWCKH